MTNEERAELSALLESVTDWAREGIAYDLHYRSHRFSVADADREMVSVKRFAERVRALIDEEASHE